MALYRNRYRIESARLPDFDYGAAGWYHVVICSHDRRPVFGEVRGGIMGLSELGVIAHAHCEAIPTRRSAVQLDAFVVMPNHVHLMIGIKVDTWFDDREDPAAPQRFGPLKPGSLPSIVQAYKAGVSRDARRSGYRDYRWQSRYYDRVIRSEREFQAKRQYVIDNPMNWVHDPLYLSL